MLLIALDPHAVADLILKILDVSLGEEGLVHRGSSVKYESSPAAGTLIP